MVLSFPARASDLKRFATIDRIGRDDAGQLSGFQRPQIAAHIREIKDYLEQSDAILPNPIVVAFTRGVVVREEQAPCCTLEIDLSDGVPGLVVDGQQRLSALMQLEDKDSRSWSRRWFAPMRPSCAGNSYSSTTRAPFPSP
jgi:DGQHR domain-containing protein